MSPDELIARYTLHPIQIAQLKSILSNLAIQFLVNSEFLSLIDLVSPEKVVKQKALFLCGTT